MMNRGCVMSFVYGDSRMDNFRLDCLLLNNRLNMMMYVVVRPLASQHWRRIRRILSIMSYRSVLEL